MDAINRAYYKNMVQDYLAILSYNLLHKFLYILAKLSSLFIKKEPKKSFKKSTSNVIILIHVLFAVPFIRLMAMLFDVMIL